LESSIKVITPMYLIHVMPSVTMQSSTTDLKGGLKCKESEPVSFIKNILKLQIWWPFKLKLDSYLAVCCVIQ